MPSLTNFPNGVGGFFVGPVIGGANGGGGKVFFCNPNASGNGNGSSPSQAFTTLQRAVDAVGEQVGCTIMLMPGQYDETVTIDRPTDGSLALTIQGMGGLGDAYIEPTTEDAGGMVVNADDVTLINVGIAAEDETSAVALTVTGSRFRAFNCKIEGGADQVVIGPGTVAQEAAGTHGVGADFIFSGCVICWGTDGIVLTCTDYGAVTQGLILNCQFHNLTGKHITEAVGSGGAAGVMFRNIVIQDNTFDDLEDGTAPTNYIDLNGDNANTGVTTGNRYPAASNGGKVLLSTAMHCVGDFFTGGISTGQPS